MNETTRRTPRPEPKPIPAAWENKWSDVYSWRRSTTRILIWCEAKLVRVVDENYGTVPLPTMEPNLMVDFCRDLEKLIAWVVHK